MSRARYETGRDRNVRDKDSARDENARLLISCNKLIKQIIKLIENVEKKNEPPKKTIKISSNHHKQLKLSFVYYNDCCMVHLLAQHT